MRIGLDLDNTIICYDRLFHAVAAERGLIPAGLATDKNTVKAQLQARYGNDAWTLLQAEVYGERLGGALPFPGVEDFIRHCQAQGAEVCVISHKSRVPARGAPHDLRSAALSWLTQHGWFSTEGLGLSLAAVEFHDTRAGKIDAIRRRRCDIFVDDLPEVFLEPGFPSHTASILFDPHGLHAVQAEWKHARTWTEIDAAVFGAVHA